jgi:tetratricopeptide (TPR) repeat protein
MPVRARGNSLRYRAGKFVRRRKVEIAAGLLVGCALLGALAISLRETRAADRQRLVAQQHFDSVRKLANTMLFDIHDELEKLPGSTQTRALLVRTSLEYLDSLYQEAGADRSLQQELGKAYAKVGDIQGKQRASNLGDFQGALRSYARAIALLEPLHSADPGDHPTAASLANTYVQQASVMLIAGKVQEARASAEKGLALTQAQAPHYASDAERFTQHAAALWALADILAALGRTPETIAALDQLVSLGEEFQRSQPDDESALQLLADVYNNASNHSDKRLSEDAQYQRAIGLLRRSEATTVRLTAVAPDNAQHRLALARSRANIARRLADRGDYTGALSLYLLAIPVMREAAADPNDARANWMSAMVQSAYAGVLFDLGRVDEARPILIKCHAVLHRLQAQSPSLRVEYALGHNGVRLGVLYGSLAGNPKLGAASRRDYWQLARDTLRPAVAAIQNVVSNVAIEPLDQKALDIGMAALARSEAAITAL